MTEEKKYELVIIGAGPAGLGASIYASRYKLDHIIVGEEIGGQIIETPDIENYPGFESISGGELSAKMQSHAKKLGSEIVNGCVSKIEKKDNFFEIFTKDEKNYKTKSIIFALGMKPRKMNLPNENEFVGKGVSYCATCDAMFFRNKEVVVIGGGNSAAISALHLSEFAEKITILYRGEKVSFNPTLKEKIEKNSKIEIMCHTVISEIKGEKKVEGIKYKENDEEKEMDIQGIFIEIGTVPGVDVAKEMGVAIDEKGYIIVDEKQATNIENVYASGDVTTGSNKFRQIITAVSEGAIAAGSVYGKLKLGKE